MSLSLLPMAHLHLHLRRPVMIPIRGGTTTSPNPTIFYNLSAPCYSRSVLMWLQMKARALRPTFRLHPPLRLISLTSVQVLTVVWTFRSAGLVDVLALVLATLLWSLPQAPTQVLSLLHPRLTRKIANG